MFRALFTLAILALLLFLAATVPLGNRTLIGHVTRIWDSDETQDLVKGVKQQAGPLVDRVKRGAEAGWEAATKHGDAGAGSGDMRTDTSTDSRSTPPEKAAPRERDVVQRVRDRVVDEAADRAGEAARAAARDQVRAGLGGR